MTTEAAVTEAVDRHRAGLWRYLRLLGCDGPTADDLVQEAFLAFLRAPFTERHPRATAAWLRAKARFLFLERVRWWRRRREARMADCAEEVFVEQAGDDGGDRYLEALRDCVGELPPRSRRALEMRYAEGAGRRRMAGALGLRGNGVKTLLARLREVLRRCVERKVRR